MSDAISAARKKIASLMAEAARLEDIAQIKRLQRAFGYYIDKGYWDEAADLFADNATFETGMDGVYAGKARIREYLVRSSGGNPGPGLPFGQLNHHMQLQPVITLSPNGKTAKGRWRELALLGQFKEFAAWGDGIYENEYAKEKGVWKIAKLRHFPNFVAPYEGGWTALKPVQGNWASDTSRMYPPDRPPTETYKPFPDIHVVPFHYKHPVTGD